MVLKGCLGRLFFGPYMHIVVAEGPGILLTNSPGWNFMSEIGPARAVSNEVSRQNNKSNAWFYCFYQKCYFFRSVSLTHWLMTHDSLTHLTHKTSVLWGTCCSPKSYFNEPAIYLSQRYIPNNVTLKKRQKPSAFYDWCPAFGWAPVIRCDEFSNSSLFTRMHCI